MDIEFLKATYRTALNFGLPIISTDTAARILAVTYCHGNNEFMCHCDKFMVEIEYIQERFGIKGSCVPNTELVKLIQQYVYQLELFEKQNPKERYPEWAIELFRTRYNIKLIN